MPTAVNEGETPRPSAKNFYELDGWFSSSEGELEYEEEQEDEDDDNDMLLCAPTNKGAPAPPRLAPSPPHHTTPPPRTRVSAPPLSGKKPKKSARANCPFKMFSHWKSRKRTKNNPGPPDEDVLIAIMDWLEDLAQEPNCITVIGGGSRTLKCRCLAILLDYDLRMLVANYIFAWGKKNLVEQREPFFEWYRYSVGMGPKRFLIPFQIGNGIENVDVSSLSSHRICTSALLIMFDKSTKYWKTITDIANNIKPKPTKHGNTGRKRGLTVEDDERAMDLHSHFNELEKLGEVRATRFVREAVEGGKTKLLTRDDDANNVYLGSTKGLRPCYYRYCQELGWDTEVTANGIVKRTWKGDVGMEVEVVHLKTYHRFWKTHYPHIKVSKPSEDICGLCFSFANRHKFRLNDNELYPKQNSSVSHDDEDDNDDDEGEGDADADEDNNDDDGDEDDKRGDSDDKVDKGDTNGMRDETDDAKDSCDVGCAGAFLDDLMDEDDDGIAPHREDETKEQMLLRAATHVECARCQRALYQHYVHKAKTHAKQKLPHNEKSYTYVVDYGQNMSLPSYNEEQPGPAYYYSPLNVYNLGVVNHAYVYDGDTNDPKEHMYAHVYHEGIAKKGANNVASLIMKTLGLENVLREGDPGGELNIVFDNCSGQNKNNTILDLVPYFLERGYFKKVNFIFLVVGHTKNAADRLFNTLKTIYRDVNCYIMEELIECLNTSKRVTVIEAVEGDFLDYDEYLHKFYSCLSGKVTFFYFIILFRHIIVIIILYYIISFHIIILLCFILKVK